MQKDDRKGKNVSRQEKQNQNLIMAKYLLSTYCQFQPTAKKNLQQIDRIILKII